MPTALILAPNSVDFANEINALLPDIELATATTSEQAAAIGTDVEVLITLGGTLTDDALAAMPRLRWIQALSAGTDSITANPALPGHVAVTSLSGAHGPQMAELALMLMMALPRRLPRMLDNQRARKWVRRPQPTLTGKRLCILGLGAIAEALIARALPFGVTITGVSDGRKEMDGVDRIHPYAGLADAARAADFLCVLAPLDDRSRGIVNAEVLTALGPEGYLISMGRGPVIDQPALIDALRAGGIGGAGLDVFDPEPLPADSPLWDFENVIVTPHVGGFSDSYAKQAAKIVAANLTLWADGGAGALKNRVR